MTNRVLRIAVLLLMVPISWAIVAWLSFFIPGSPWQDVPEFAQRAQHNQTDAGLWEEFESIGRGVILYGVTVYPALMGVLIALAAILLRCRPGELVAPAVGYLAGQLMTGLSGLVHALTGTAVLATVMLVIVWPVWRRRTPQ